MLAREEMLRKLHARDEYYRRRARRSFAEFLRHTKPDYQLSWFHEELAGELDQFLDDVIEKRSPRLIINVPPQEGKSEQVSRRFPAYALGRDPNLRVVACSYSATLALQFSRDVQLIMDEPNYARLFPESIIPGVATSRSAAVRQADHFELVRHHGSYRCAGVQGSIAGFPCDVLIVDDPYKHHLEAHSLVVREAVWNNFVSVLLPRLQEGRGVLICSTRWHQDDLVGRLLEREPGKWKLLSYPAIAEEDEPHRSKGEPLSPRFSLESRLEHKERIGEYLWSALFQQSPVAESGNLLKRYKWRYWRYPGMNLPPVSVQNDKGERFEVTAEELPAQFNREIQSWDLSFEGEPRSDYVVGLHVATAGAKRYILDSVHEKLDFSATIAAIQSFRAKYPQTSGIYIENRANGAAAINTLSQQIPGINKVSPSKSKYDRAFASSDELNAGNWLLPHPQLAQWVDTFLFEVSAFPRGKNDDFVDAWTQSREALSGADVADYSMYTADNVARFEQSLMRMGYSAEHFIPPGLRSAGRGEMPASLFRYSVVIQL